MDALNVGVWQMWAVFGFVALAVFLYSKDEWPLEISSLALLSGLLVFFQIFPVAGPDGANMLGNATLLEGFANPALISVLALLTLGQGLFQTGALERPARFVADVGASRPGTTFTLILLFVAIVSAFLNNTPVTVIFIPILAMLAARLQRASSEVMIPLSYIAILGGMTTLIGSSTNLLAAGLVREAGLPPLTMFDFTIPGTMLALVGFLYCRIALPRILPARAELAEAFTSGSEGKQFIAQIQITQGHPLIGVESVAGLFPPLKDMTVRMIQRGERAILPPFEDIVLREGDDVIVATTRKTLTESLKSNAALLRGTQPEKSLAADMPEAGEPAESEDPTGNRARRSGELLLAEAVVAPASRMIGRNIAQIAFHAQTNCILLGIQRRSRMIRSTMNDIRLEAGDVLLVLGREDQIAELRTNRDILILEWSATALPEPQMAIRALLVFGATMLTVITGALSIPVAAILGATGMILTGALNVRQAARSIDRRIFLMVGSAIALATALEVTGGAQFIATGVVTLFADAGVPVLLSAFFLVTAIITNIMTNNATAVLFTPIAINTAVELNANPIMFVVTVILAANCSFATPMGYQTNLLVMGPGNYQFNDFMRAGIPLVVLLWAVFSAFAPWYYGL